MPPKKDHNINRSAIGFPLPVAAGFMSLEQKQSLYSANAKLCQLVKRCPWMYDRQHPSYAKKHIMDKSWTKIAKDCDDSVASCKERWRNIRAAFARSINIYKTSSGPNRVKPYYLYDDLTFLIKPMTDGRDTTHRFPEDVKCDWEDTRAPPTLPATTYQLMEAVRSKEVKRPIPQGFAENRAKAVRDVEADLTIPVASAGAEDVAEAVEVDEELMNSMVDISGTMLPPAPSTVDSTTVVESRTDNVRANTNPNVTGHDLLNRNGDADAKFLEALLPDMRTMNTRQKIVFKRKIYQSLEEVFEDNADFSTMTNSTTIRPCGRAVATAGSRPPGMGMGRTLFGTANNMTPSIRNLNFQSMMMNQRPSAGPSEQNGTSRHPLLKVNPRVAQSGNIPGAAKGGRKKSETRQPIIVKDELNEAVDMVLDFY